MTESNALRCKLQSLCFFSDQSLFFKSLQFLFYPCYHHYYRRNIFTHHYILMRVCMEDQRIQPFLYHTKISHCACKGHILGFVWLHCKITQKNNVVAKMINRISRFQENALSLLHQIGILAKNYIVGMNTRDHTIS